MNEMNGIRHCFTSGEKLKLRKNIETLFQTGEAFSVFPIRVIYTWKKSDESFEFPVQIGVSIPKKKFNRAVHRNLLKRRLREGWRLNKHLLYQVIPPNIQLHAFLIYTDNSILPSADIHAAIRTIISRFIKHIPAHTSAKLS